MTRLPAAGRSLTLRPLVFGGGALIVAVSLLLLILRVLPATKAVPASASTTNLSPAVAAMPNIVTNQFSVSPFQLQKAAGSSIVHVVGRAKNLSDRERFGVRVVFGLWDANGKRLGEASDYVATLPAGANWKFEAMVLESKTSDATLESIQETK